MQNEITFTEAPSPEASRIGDAVGFPRQSGITYGELMVAKMTIFPSNTSIEEQIRQALLAKGKWN